jgi:hypothetical protein
MLTINIATIRYCRVVWSAEQCSALRLNSKMSISISGRVKTCWHMKEEQRPTAVSPEGFQAPQRRIPDLRPKLPGPVKPALILFAG